MKHSKKRLSHLDDSDDPIRKTPDCITFAQLAADALTAVQLEHVRHCRYCQSMRRGKALAQTLDIDVSSLMRMETSGGIAVAAVVGATAGATVGALKAILKSASDDESKR